MKKLIFTFLSVLLISAPIFTHAAILLDNSTTLSGESASTSFSATVTVNKNYEGILTCEVDYSVGTRYATKMFDNGVAMTRLFSTPTSAAYSSFGELMLWSIVNPSVGTNTINGSSSVSSAPVAACQDWVGVNPANPVDSATYTTATSTNFSTLSVTTSSRYSGELFISNFAGTGGPTGPVNSPAHGEITLLAYATNSNEMGMEYMIENALTSFSTGFNRSLNTTGTLATLGFIPIHRNSVSN